MSCSCELIEDLQELRTVTSERIIKLTSHIGVYMGSVPTLKEDLTEEAAFRAMHVQGMFEALNCRSSVLPTTEESRSSNSNTRRLGATDETV